MTWSRAVSLGALIAVLLGIATGLSHIGHTSVSTCTGTWRVVVGHSTDPHDNATENARARAAVPGGAPCYGSIANPKGGYDAYALLGSEADAQTFVQQLLAAGYAKMYDFQPYVEQIQQTATP